MDKNSVQDILYMSFIQPILKSRAIVSKAAWVLRIHVHIGCTETDVLVGIHTYTRFK